MRRKSSKIFGLTICAFSLCLGGCKRIREYTGSGPTDFKYCAFEIDAYLKNTEINFEKYLNESFLVYKTEDDFKEHQSFIDQVIKKHPLCENESIFNIPVDYSKQNVYFTLVYSLGDWYEDFFIDNIVWKDTVVTVNAKAGNNKKTKSDISSSLFTYIVLPKDKEYTVNQNIHVIPEDPEPYEPKVKKPIIYFYPEEEMDLQVIYDQSERLITTYPKYNDGWNIHLNEDGTFNVIGEDREYYAIYFDEYGNYKCTFEEGFYVTKENAVSFLEEKLDILGFTNREADEFIMYWLPILEQNEKSLVYFETTEERNVECPLTFSVEPDTMLRTIIHIKKVNEEVDIKEQIIPTVERSGFTVVEWGGTEY